MYKIKIVNKSIFKRKKLWILITSGIVGTSIISGGIYNNINKRYYGEYNGSDTPRYQDRIIWDDYVSDRTEVVYFFTYPSDELVVRIFKGLSNKQYYKVSIDGVDENSEWMEIPKDGLITINRNDFSDNQYYHDFKLCFSSGSDDNALEYCTLFASECSKDQIKVFSDRRKRMLEEIKGKIKDSDSDFDKVKKVYDYVIHSVAYNHNPVSQSDIENLNYCYDNFLGVYYTDCAGYADIINYIFDNIDIDSFSVVDNTHGHVWNVVNVDGKYYHLDATYSDTGSYYGTSKYRYFLVSDDFMRSENRWFIKEKDVSCDEMYDLENIVREKDVKYRGFK